MRTLDVSEAGRTWGVRRLRLLLLVVLIGALGVLVGVAMLIARSVQPALIVGDGAPPGGGFGAPSPASVRDRIAAAVLPSVDAAAATRPDPATEVAPPIHIPEPTVGRGPVGVPVFGHTAEGAVAQLAAIDESVLEAMSVPQAREVHYGWVQPDGPSFEEWDLTQNLTAFLRGARQSATKDVTTIVKATPSAGLVKGTDGPDWVLACVLLDVEATIQTSYRMGWANCQRMQWTGQRWLIGSGAQPAKAPSAWPGSKAALAAGWLAWTPDEGEPAMIPLPNPFELMGSVAGKIVVDGWTAGMLAIWNGGLWVLRLVLGWVDSLLSPDLSEQGPAAELYRVTFWLAGVVLLVMTIVQIGIAAGRRDGKGLARVLIGVGQFAIVWGGWIGYTVAVTAACSGLTRALMESLMNVTNWSAWQPWTPIDAKDVTDAATATVLGMMGVLVWVAAIAHVIVMLTRAAALMVIVATTPIAAAGLANDTTRGWFWKAFRWFHAAAFTPVVVVLVNGIGMKFAEGVANGQSSGPLQAVATAIPAIVLICIAAFSPLALFKLLAFVDPGTASGAAMRAGMASVGGLQGLLRGNVAAGESAATQVDDSGRSAGEADSEGATSARIANAGASAASFLGPVGAVAASGLGLMAKLGTASAAVGADVTNQAGVGHNSYYPDYTGGGGDGARANREARGEGDDAAPSEAPTPDVTPPPTTEAQPAPTANSAPAPSAPSGSTSSASGTIAAEGSAAEVAEVAVVAL